MNLKIFQKGFNYSQDGDGNRLVYHLQGCNMKCPWCANPEGMSMEGILITDREWMFDGQCPHGAVMDGTLNREVCKNCTDKECIKAHKGKGIRLSYEEVAVEDVFQEIIDSSPMFYDGGGVTFSGGEATMQFDSLKALLIKLKTAEIHTAIETNGSHPRLPELFPFIDQLIMDCKHWEEEQHKHYTGISSLPIIANLRKAAASHPKVDIRVPVIGGVNNQTADFEQFVKLFKEINGLNLTYEILKYHEFGMAKWEQCGFHYIMTEDAHVSDQQIKEFRELIKAHGLRNKQS